MADPQIIEIYERARAEVQAQLDWITEGGVARFSSRQSDGTWKDVTEEHLEYLRKIVRTYDQSIEFLTTSKST